MDNRRSEHKVVLPDEVWSETLIQATLEQKTASRAFFESGAAGLVAR